VNTAAALQRPKKRTGSLSEHAYLMIRERILHGDLTVGTELSRRRLAEELKISPVPVMGALQRLEGEGLVESRPRVGTRVRVPKKEDIRDEFTFREGLEVHSARLFSEKASSAERSELLRMARNLDDLDAQIERAEGRESQHELILAEHRLHMRVHVRIAECTGCRALIRSIALNQALIFKWLLDLIPRLKLPSRWHENLIESVSVENPDAAGAAMRLHVRHGMDNVLRSIEQLGQ
jgi:DNA-binding GntR family transcriptional regulator